MSFTQGTQISHWKLSFGFTGCSAFIHFFKLQIANNLFNLGKEKHRAVDDKWHLITCRLFDMRRREGEQSMHNLFHRGAFFWRIRLTFELSETRHLLIQNFPKIILQHKTSLAIE